MRSHYFILDGAAKAGDGIVVIGGQDAKHISKVLRLRAGDLITVSDGTGRIYQVELGAVGDKQVSGRVTETTPFSIPDKRLTVFQGLPKGRKMNLIVEKLTELGAARIAPVALARSVPDYAADRGAKRLGRWKAIAYEASKQSRRPWLPDISEVLSWAKALAELDVFDEVLVPYEDFKDLKLDDVFEAKGNTAVFIGPEGGFEESEIADLRNRGVKLFSLGDNILRTETAAIAAAALILNRTNS